MPRIGFSGYEEIGGDFVTQVRMLLSGGLAVVLLGLL
jgi:hypothetical protein